MSRTRFHPNGGIGPRQGVSARFANEVCHERRIQRRPAAPAGGRAHRRSVVKLEAATVAAHARGQWIGLLGRLAPTLERALARPGRHVPCPVHGGRDGFRVFRDCHDTGGGICNTCGSFRDGFALLMWANGWGFREALEAVARDLRLDGGGRGRPRNRDRTPHPPRRQAGRGRAPRPPCGGYGRRPWTPQTPEPCRCGATSGVGGSMPNRTPASSGSTPRWAISTKRAIGSASTRRWSPGYRMPRGDR